MGASELLEAIAADDAERARALVRKRPASAGVRDESGVSALMRALYRGQEEVAAAIREALPELDVFEAAALGDVEALRDRLDSDPASLFAWSADGFTALHFAAFFGEEETARLLIGRGADLEAPSRNVEFAPQARPLHSALAARRRGVAAMLLAAGADANARQHGGSTPLLQAAQHGDDELVELLLEHGADSSARLEDGRTAIDLARAAGATELADRLGARAPG